MTHRGRFPVATCDNVMAVPPIFDSQNVTGDFRNTKFQDVAGEMVIEGL